MIIPLNQSRSYTIIALMKIIVVVLFAICFSANGQERIISNIPLSMVEERCMTYLDSSKKAYDEADYVSFKKFNDSVLTIACDHNLLKLQIKALINHGIYYNVINEYEKAMRQFHNALEISENYADDENIKVNILVNLANVYSQIGNIDKVITTMEQVIAISQKKKVSDVIKIAAYNGLGIAYSRKENYGKALEYLYKLKDIGEQTNNSEAILAALDNIGYLQYQRTLWDSVIAVSKESLEYSEEHTLSKRSVAMLNLGMAYVKKTEPEIALPYLKEVLAIAKEKNNLKIEKEGHLHLAKAYKLMGDFENSQKEQELYAELMKGLLQEESKATVLDIKHNANSEKRNMESKLNSLAGINHKKSTTLVIGGISIVLLGGMLFFYIRKKKTAEIDSEKFKVANALLKIENKTLRTKMIEMALQQQERNREAGALYKNSSLTEQDRNRYTNLILDYMQKEKPYLNFDINQTVLAAKLSMSRHHLSEVLNLSFNQNFYQFINLYRVNEAQEIMKDPSFSNYKILAIGYESGFKSKTSFNRVFKNHTGITPSEYRKNLFPDILPEN